MAAPPLQDMAEVAKAVQRYLQRAAVAVVEAAKQVAEKVPDGETMTKGLRSKSLALMQKVQGMNFQAFELCDPKDQSSAEELFVTLKLRAEQLLQELSKLPSTSALVLFLVLLRSGLVLGRLSLPVLREVLDGELLRSRFSKFLAATPSILMLQKHRRHLLQDVPPSVTQGRLVEAFVQLCHNAKPLPPLFWLSFAFAGLQTLQVSERVSLWSVHVALRYKRSALLAAAMLVVLRRQVPSLRLQEKYFGPQTKEAMIAFWKQSWKVLQDLASAAKSAVLHGFGSGAPGAGDGAPPRVAPGEVFSSPRSGASEGCVVSEIQQPPVFAGEK